MESPGLRTTCLVLIRQSNKKKIHLSAIKRIVLTHILHDTVWRSTAKIFMAPKYPQTSSEPPCFRPLWLVIFSNLLN